LGAEEPVAPPCVREASVHLARVEGRAAVEGQRAARVDLVRVRVRVRTRVRVRVGVRARVRVRVGVDRARGAALDPRDERLERWGEYNARAGKGQG